jgi:hypothetical protein
MHTMHGTLIFTWKPNAGEKHIILFLYVKNYIQGSTNLLDHVFIDAKGLIN